MDASLHAAASQMVHCAQELLAQLQRVRDNKDIVTSIEDVAKALFTFKMQYNQQAGKGHFTAPGFATDQPGHKRQRSSHDAAHDSRDQFEERQDLPSPDTSPPRQLPSMHLRLGGISGAETHDMRGRCSSAAHVASSHDDTSPTDHAHLRMTSSAAHVASSLEPASSIQPTHHAPLCMTFPSIKTILQHPLDDPAPRMQSWSAGA